VYRKIEDFQTSWAHEAEGTLRIFRALTDETLLQKIYEHGRELGFLAWHLTQTLGEMMEKAGLTIDAPAEDAEMPANVGEIVSAYERGAKSIGEEVSKNWTDDDLTEEVEMYGGEKWSKGVVLSALSLHQAHHRGQMTVLMRQAGLKVPGIYGPSREEWEAYGMPALK
jgi:uncharacterized damage-inducible protein DinB